MPPGFVALPLPITGEGRSLGEAGARPQTLEGPCVQASTLLHLPWTGSQISSLSGPRFSIGFCARDVFARTRARPPPQGCSGGGEPHVASAQVPGSQDAGVKPSGGERGAEAVYLCHRSR